MPKFSEGTFALGALFLFALWLFVALPILYAPQQQWHGGASAAQNETQSGSPAPAAPKSDTKQDHEKANKQQITVFETFFHWVRTFFEIKLTDVLIVFFTAVLAVKTGGLFTETAGLRSAADQQALDMKASIKAATDAASAAASQALSAARQAKVAEDALFKFERPYILVTSLSYIKPPETRQIGDKIRIVPGHHVTYKIGNFGRMAGLVHDVRHVFQVAAAAKTPENPFSMTPPPRPISDGFDAGYALAAGEIEEDQTFTLPKDTQYVDKSGWFDPALSSGQTIYMFIQVRYEDAGAVGLVRDYVSAWRYDFSQHRFLRCGGQQHNYERCNFPEAASQ